MVPEGPYFSRETSHRCGEHEAITIDHRPAEERQPNWACYVYEIIFPKKQMRIDS